MMHHGLRQAGAAGISPERGGSLRFGRGGVMYSKFDVEDFGELKGRVSSESDA